jgi:hypothetical protein
MTAMKSIREWYGSQPSWVRKVNFSFLLFFAFALLVALTKSGPEFRAIIWHLRHGNRVTVNGVTFPVYFWYAPDSSRDSFSVFDQPGPLRPNDRFTTFSINRSERQERHRYARRIGATRNACVLRILGRGHVSMECPVSALEMYAGAQRLRVGRLLLWRWAHLLGFL